MGAEPTVRLYLLGQFAVDYHGERVQQSAWKRRRPVELLTLLALAQGRVLHREEVIDRLWPEKELDAGANNLYRSLHDLRKVTGDDVVFLDSGVVRLADNVWTDVSAFQDAVAQGSPDSLAQAVRLYAGDLLPDEPYTEHLQSRREGLRQRFVDAGLRLARHLCEAKAPDRDLLIDVLRRVLDCDATLEEAHRLLMKSLAESGRIQDAVRQFTECERALRDALGTSPSSQTRDLYFQIRAGDVESTPPVPATATPAAAPAVPVASSWEQVARRFLGTGAPRPVRGRDQELRQAKDFIDSSAGALVVVGEAGAGKTRFSMHCAERSAESGALVLAGVGSELAGAAPYTPFVDAWSDVSRVAPQVDNVFTSFRPSGGSAQEDRLRLFEAVETALSTLAANGSVFLLIEDLHQADESSLHLFHHLARATRRLPLKLVGTLREESLRAGSPAHQLVGSLQRERAAHRINLSRLSGDATAQLVRDLWGSPPSAEQLETIVRLAGGNPFYTEEIAASVRESESRNIALSDDLKETVRSRIARIGADAEKLLVAAAVHGDRFEFETVRLVMGAEMETALDALDHSLNARALEEHDGSYRFRHALMREALYDSLSTARRAHLHRETAKALESSTERIENDPEGLAWHYGRAGDKAKALPYKLQAIKRAQSRLGFSEAIAHSQGAIDLLVALGQLESQDGFRVLRDMGGMLVAQGELDRAIKKLARAAELHSSDWRPSERDRCNAKRLAALALIEAGDLAKAEALLDEGLSLIEGTDHGAELTNLFYLFSQLRWHQGRHEEAFAMAEKCLGEAEALDDTVAIAKGYEMLALACHSLGEWKKGSAFEERRKEVSGALDVASAFDVHL